MKDVSGYLLEDISIIEGGDGEIDVTNKYVKIDLETYIDLLESKDRLEQLLEQLEETK